MADVELPLRTWREPVSKVAAVFLGAILVVATIGKIGDPILFVEQIRKEGLDFLLPAYLVAVIGLAVEMALGMLLVLGVRHRLVLWASGLLVAFFVFLTGRNYYLVLTGQRDPAYDCGCFGVFLQRTATEAFWQDLFLLVPPLVLACLSPSALRSAVPAWKSAVTGLATLALVFYTLGFVDLPRHEPILAVASGTPGLLHPAEHFGVWVDGEELPGARVLESDLDLRLVVWGEEWDDLLVLDIRTTQVFTAPKAVTSWLDSGDLQMASDAPMMELGAFEVSPEGLTLTHLGKVIQIRNR